jgi:RNA-directed DNA polymerase
VISPLLANIYLHYTLDLWVARWRQHTATGDMIIVRYADDFIVGFQHESDAERFRDEMRDRLGKFALSLHPEKTRLMSSDALRRSAASGAASANRKPSTS